MGSERRASAIERVWNAVERAPQPALVRTLPPTDLQTLLLDVAHHRADAVSGTRLMHRWRDDRFVQPSSTDPRALARVECRLWELLPASFAGLELSPVTPLGTSSAMSMVHQDQVLTTTRGTEVVSDLTNVLALEAARRRRADPAAGRVDLAACHRVLRAQPFDAPGYSAHFRLFALVSSARDTGSGATQAALLASHLGFWAAALADLLPHTAGRLRFTSFDSPVLAERFADTVKPALDPLPPNVTVVEDPARTRGRGYYVGAAIGLDTGPMPDLGDGGLTDWTARLLSDGKERCLTSCVATERLTALS